MPKAIQERRQLAFAKHLVQLGYDVVSLSGGSHGAPALLVGGLDRQGRPQNVLLLVKTARGRVTKAEADWALKWRGPFKVVRSLDEAREAVQ